MGIWVYLYKQSDFVKTFIQTESSVRNSATFGLFLSNEQNSVKKTFCYLVFTTLIQNQKMHHCIVHLKEHQIVKSGGPKSNQSKKFTGKSVGFNFVDFLG